MILTEEDFQSNFDKNVFYSLSKLMPDIWIWKTNFKLWNYFWLVLFCFYFQVWIVFKNLFDPQNGWFSIFGLVFTLILPQIAILTIILFPVILISTLFLIVKKHMLVIRVTLKNCIWLVSCLLVLNWPKFGISPQSMLGF